MRRQLDLLRVQRIMDQRHLDPNMVADRTRLPLNQGGPAWSNLADLFGVSAGQLVRLAEVLEVAVDELLTPPLDAWAVEQQGQDRDFPSLDADALHAVLVQFGSLSDHALCRVFNWTPQRLEDTITVLARRLGDKGVTPVRQGDRVILEPAFEALPSDAQWRVTDLADDSVTLAEEHAPYLVTAVRAHALGPYPGPPMVPRPVIDTLARQGAARPPDAHAPPGRPARLFPHDDLMFALRLHQTPPDRVRAP
ncbi:hypothetical protein ETD83_12710 [Actinomadura soli]|uniref:Uncharacterized protein n=1 Tax=Actinomadura soli TaxID=2508997 RepID=A0A5C4JE45_9ACTN|nr:hypothetical protein [Actinomadura soli]TMR02400.1 hypothetical protein ETD83_12710 [Actinomadura soli]